MNPPRRAAWTWALLAMAMAWAAISRAPLVLNAETHLDSDLAVDGLTLSEAVRGHWRWHYPASSYMGTLPVALSWPQAAIWGANPRTLVSGGAVAYGLAILATFHLGRVAFGPRVAAWGLVPLAFGSTGALWLSGRVTGGHLPAAAWHAEAFALLHGCLALGGPRRAAALGLWCGLGIYLDRMLSITAASVLAAALGAWWASGRPARAWRCVPAFAMAAVVGFLPHEVGTRMDPDDAYREQFDPILDRWTLLEHARLLVLECLPRLVAGHLLPDLRAESELPVALRPLDPRRDDPAADPVAWAATVGSLALFGIALGALARGPVAGPGRDLAGSAVRGGLLLSSGAVVAGFLLNRNVFNSDNYRYLVFLLVPWSVGFGLAMDAIAGRGRPGIVTAGLLAAALAAVMTADLARYYRRFGWIDAAGRPVRRPLSDPALDWVRDHPEVRSLGGGYWDVYRLAFLTGGRVEGVPYPQYPNRFPERTRRLPAGRPAFLILRRTRLDEAYRQAALRDGGKELVATRDFAIYSWPAPGGPKP